MTRPHSPGGRVADGAVGKRSGRRCHGPGPRCDAVAHLAAAGADAVGANCGRGPAEMEIIAAEMAQARTDDILLVAQSNAGLPQVVGDHFEYDATPGDMASHAARLAELGIDLVGGCCGSAPAHIAAIGATLTPA